MMPVSTISSGAERMPWAADGPPVLKAQPSAGFETALDAAGSADDERQAQAQEIASSLVATAFVMPALEQMRDSPFRSELFAPGDAERRFGPVFDRAVAERLTSSGRFPLVDAIANHITTYGSSSSAGSSGSSTQKVDAHG